MPDKLPWISPHTGRFEVKTCIGARKYLAHKTGLTEADIEVHKTDKYLIVNAIVNGKLTSAKIDGPFLYTMSEFDFAPLVEFLTPKP